MTPKQKIEQADKKFKQWKKSLYQKRDDRIEDSAEKQRDFLNRKRRTS